MQSNVLLWYKYLLIFGVLLALMACQAEVPFELVYPSTQARIMNPVRLQASQSVKWYNNGLMLGEGSIWTGNLPEGKQRLSAVRNSQELEFGLTILPSFPKLTMRRFEGKNTPSLDLPSGRFVLMFGNTSDRTITLEDKPNRNIAQKALEANSANTSLEPEHPPAIAARTQHALRSRVPAAGLEKLRSASNHASTTNLKPLPETGSTRTFRMLDLNGTGGSDLSAELIHIGEHTLAYVEQMPTPTDPTLLQQIINAYESHVFDRVTQHFGVGSDVDDNDRVILLFSPRLNASKLAVGFFAASDLMQRSPENPDSNEAEILYLGLPEDNDPNFTTSSLAATSCHEMTHLIHFGRKTLPHLADPEPVYEEVAVSEGLAHLAEDLCGYNRTGGNLAFVARFLTSTSSTSLDGISLNGQGDTVERRGVMYLFMRFVLEQYGLQTLNSIMRSDQVGLENIATITKQPLETLLWRFWWATELRNGQQTDQFSGFQPPHWDSVTGELIGINLKAGRFLIPPSYEFELEGVPHVAQWPSKLPPHAWAVMDQTGPARVALPTGVGVAVMRVE
jgi:hypothetical protein